MNTSDCDNYADYAEDSEAYLEGYLGTVARRSHVMNAVECNWLTRW